MKPFVFLALATVLGCQSPTSIPIGPVTIVDSLGIFEPVKTTPLVTDAVESSLSIAQNGVPSLYWSPTGSAALNVNIGTDPPRNVSNGGYRFQYVLFHAGIWYIFFESGGDIFLNYSQDGLHFAVMNSGQPVLTHQVGTIYEQLWNVGADIDDTGTWRILVECAVAASSSPGLATSYATLSGNSISFDANKSATFLIANGGNPQLNYIPSRGWLITYGKIAANGYWYVTMATTDASFGNFAPSPNFYIAYANCHVADPSLIEYGDGTYLTFSIYQNAIYGVKTGATLVNIYDTVK